MLDGKLVKFADQETLVYQISMMAAPLETS